MVIPIAQKLKQLGTKGVQNSRNCSYVQYLYPFFLRKNILQLESDIQIKNEKLKENKRKLRMKDQKLDMLVCGISSNVKQIENHDYYQLIEQNKSLHRKINDLEKVELQNCQLKTISIVKMYNEEVNTCSFNLERRNSKHRSG